MKLEKAYKLLANAEKISNRAAKELIDRGVVYSRGEKITVARGEMPLNAKFKVLKSDEIVKIYEDKNMLVVNKPAYILSEDVAKKLGHPLLHRLDKETSGVLILSKDEEFTKKAIEEFKALRVEKIYLAIVGGRVVEPIKIDFKIETIKKESGAISKISDRGKEAITEVEPLLIEGKNSLVKVKILTGRTHQIRVHLKEIGHPLLGDERYGGKKAPRVMLHAYALKIFDKSFKAKLPNDFAKLGFETDIRIWVRVGV